MNAAYQKHPIPKEVLVVCTPQSTVHHDRCIAALNKVNDQKHRRTRRNRMTDTSTAGRKCLDHSTPEHVCLSSSIGFEKNRRRESLQSVSRKACSEAQKFLEAEHKDILLEYSTEENCNPQPVQNENELSLSQLAGLLSAKLGDAIERGLFSGEDSTKPSDSEKKRQGLPHYTTDNKQGNVAIIPIL